MLQLLVILFAALFLAAAGRLFLLQRELRGITATIRRIHGRATNERISVATRNRRIADLANAVNEQYDDMFRERSEHARAIDDMRGSMADISHDLRTPLTSILGYVKLLRSGGNTPEQQEQYLDVVYSKATALNALINSLFVLARLEAGAYPLELARIDAQAVLAEELAGFYGVLTDGGRQPELSLSEEPLWMIGDAGALTRVFSNLLNNMARHGAGSIRIASGSEGGRVVLTFQNRAEGLTKADVSRLFQRFFTADRMRSGESTGLGLSIVKEFVEQMGGDIGAALDGETLTIRLSFRADNIRKAQR